MKDLANTVNENIGQLIAAALTLESDAFNSSFLPLEMDNDSFEITISDNGLKMYLNKDYIERFKEFNLKSWHDLNNHIIVYCKYTEDGIYVGYTLNYGERECSHLKDSKNKLQDETLTNLYESMNERGHVFTKILHVFESSGTEEENKNIGRGFENKYLNALIDLKQEIKGVYSEHIFNVNR